LHSDLEIIEDLVLNKLASSNLNVDSVSILEEWITIAKNYQAKFHGLLLNKILSFQKDKQIILYMHSVQSRLIFLSDKLYFSDNDKHKNIVNHPPQPLNLSDVQQYVLSVLEGLISIIETQMPLYFNIDAKVTELHNSTMACNFKVGSNLLLKQLKNIDHKLLELILNPFREIMHDKKFNLTYRKSNYLNELLVELMKTIEETGPQEITEVLKEKLIYLNFNSWRLFRYLVKEMTSRVQEEESLTDKILKYYNYLKFINCTYIKSNAILHKDGKSLKEMLADWLSEEIYVKEKEYQFIHGNSENNNPINDFKILMPLSVPQLAYLTRVFVDTGLIQNKKLNDLFNHLSIHIQTKRSENISPKNLSNHFYEPDDKSTEMIKTYMINIINEINKI
jgi:hypothetical protein